MLLPQVDKYLPTETGEPPLGNAKGWTSPQGYPMELNTMPGWAGSSWYFLRDMDPHNEKAFASPQALNYWRDVDLYVGGRNTLPDTCCILVSGTSSCTTWVSCRPRNRSASSSTKA